MPGHTYSGVVINSALGTPAAGAIVSASRPNQHRTPLTAGTDMLDHLVGDEPHQETIGQAVADREGRFTLQTRSGYADRLEAVNADRRVAGSADIHSRDASGLRVILAPRVALFMYDEPIHPDDPAFKTAHVAMNQVAVYAAAHPREPLLSLEGYAGRGIISREALDNFKQHSKLFFAAKPAVQFSLGDRLIQMRDTQRPLTLRTDEELLAFRDLANS